jgi:hypothetical protein
MSECSGSRITTYPRHRFEVGNEHAGQISLSVKT